MDKVGQRIKHYRNLKGLSLAQVGLKINVTRGYLSKVENNKIAVNMERLFDIAKALDIDAYKLVSDEFENGWEDVTSMFEKEGLTPDKVKSIFQTILTIK